MPSSHASVGVLLKQRRKYLDLTQEALAQQVGCAVSTIRKIERGALRPSRQFAERLAVCLELEEEEREAFVRLARTGPTSDQPAQPGPAEPAPQPPSQPQPRPFTTATNSFVGREAEIGELGALLQKPEPRLLTLTGGPGVGKTRLAAQLATQLLPSFADGVVFVRLAAVGEPGLVLGTIAQELGIKEAKLQTLEESLLAFLQERALLLVLDNFEHLLPATPLLAGLLRAPRLKLLVTSRVSLQLPGEQEYPIAPLAVPNPDQLPELEQLLRSPSVALFLDRARATTADFTLTEETATLVARICAQVEGLPLSIELASAWVKVFSLYEISGLLGRRLTLLTGGSPHEPRRHQSLRAAIEWSYQLLSPEEQALFARLGVFRGGWTLSAADAICVADQQREPVQPAAATPLSPVVMALRALLNASVIQRVQQSEVISRYTMLETMREYALERLGSSGELEQVQQRHADYYLALVEQVRTHMKDEEQPLWLERLDQDYPNVRTALRWSYDSDKRVMTVRFVTALCQYWVLRNQLSEAREWMEHVLALSDDLAPQQRLGLLNNAASIAYYSGDDARAELLLGETLALRRELRDEDGLRITLHNLGNIAYNRGDYARCRALFEESLSLEQKLGDRWGIARSFSTLATVIAQQGDYETARRYGWQAIEESRAIGDQQGAINSMNGLAELALLQGAYAEAWALYQECLRLSRGFDMHLNTLSCLIGIASLLLRCGPEPNASSASARRAARLLGGAESLLTSGFELEDPLRGIYDSTLALARGALEAAFDEEWHVGKRRPLPDIIDEALEQSMVDLTSQRRAFGAQPSTMS